MLFRNRTEAARKLAEALEVVRHVAPRILDGLHHDRAITVAGGEPRRQHAAEGRVLLQRQHLLFHRVFGDQPVGEHLARLADAMRAVHRLRLHRRVPPRVEQEHVLRGGEVEARAAGLEAHQEGGHRLVLLEAPYPRLPVPCPAVQVEVRNPRLLEPSAKDLQHLHELAEHQHLLAFGDQPDEVISVVRGPKRAGIAGGSPAHILSVDKKTVFVRHSNMNPGSSWC